MADPLREIASPLAQQVLEMRTRRHELETPVLDPRHRDLQPQVTAVRVVRRLRDLDEAEPELGVYEGLRLRHGR